ncbi:MAG: lipoprotein [Betaproteobacteria bacterium]|nr:lipoprotein [Betaproteobacteria bacterium]
MPSIRLCHILAILALTFLLSACGQRGPLKLPQEPTKNAFQPTASNNKK